MRGRLFLVLAIALAGPTVLLLDLLVRRFAIGAQPEEVRSLLAATMTPLAWWVVPLPLVGGVVGFLWYPPRWAKARARWQRDPATSAADAVQRAELEALLLTTTLAQVPALLGDLSVMLGAEMAPALCATSLSVAAVLLIGLLGPRRIAARMREQSSAAANAHGSMQ